MFTVGPFALDQATVDARKAALGITGRDEERLARAHLHLQDHARAVIERFYEYLLAHPHLREMLGKPGLLAHLKEVQVRYFEELTSGRYGLEYFENRLRVGLAHHRVGLGPEWYLAAYLRYLHIVVDVLREALGRDVRDLVDTVGSLTKVIYLDMGLALDAYFYTAQQALEDRAESLASAHEALLRTEAARRQLAEMIVHDLQNPLTGIRALLELLSESRLEPGLHEAVGEALVRCDDLHQMIQNVLQLSRAESGRLDVLPGPVDLAEVARSRARAFALAAERKGGALLLQADRPVAVVTDRHLLDRILDNLLRNSVRHTPPGTRITLTVEAGGPAPRVVVADDGPGIPPEALPHLFEPGSAGSLARAGIRVDSGLGLAFCRLASERLGIALRVDSRPGEGTAFTLTFPPAPRHEPSDTGA